MKKLMVFCFLTLACVLFALACVNFSFDALDRIERDKASLVIEKPENVDNREFLKQIEAVLTPIGVDMMFRYIDVSDGQTTYYYCKTNLTEDFLDISTNAGSIRLEVSACISTKDQAGFTVSRLYASPILQDISIFAWEQAEQYDLSAGTYCVRVEQQAEAARAIHELGYSVTPSSAVYISGQYSVLLFGFVPAFMLIASMAFYVLSNGKKNVLEKMEGYTTQTIIWDEIRQIAPTFVVGFLVIEAITLAVAAVVHHIPPLLFLAFSLKYIFLLIGIVAIGFALSMLLIAGQKGAEHIKGKVPRRGIYVTTILAKCVFAAFIVFFLSIALRNASIAWHTARTAQFLSEKVEGYVTVPINNNNTSSTDLADCYRAFYTATVDRYHGILVDASNYSYDLISGTTRAEEYGQDSITVNGNYLTFNPIYDVYGQAISADMLPDGTFPVVLPDAKQYRADAYRERIRQGYGMEASFFIYDSAATQVYSYNASTGTGSYGALDAPVILVVPDERLEGIFIESYCSKGEYFLKVPSDDPYGTLLPVLRETGIAPVTLSTPSVSSSFEETEDHQKFMLSLYGTQSAVLLIGLFCLILFSAKLYCENYRHKIAACLIEGYSLFSCIKTHLIVTVIYYGAAAVVLRFIRGTMHVAMNPLLLPLVFLGEMCVTFAVSRTYTKQNLYQIVKGAES